jgi:pyrroloquinoline quinone biosynthesis protein D
MAAVTASSVPALRRGIRRRFDETRQAHVLLGPERVVVLDEIAVAITELVDATNSVAEISRMLSAKFGADYAVVEVDVTLFVQDLVDKGLAVS